MPRRKRVVAEGAMYHIDARVTRREAISADPVEAGAWIADGSRRRRTDREFAALVESLEAAITRELWAHVGSQDPHD